VGVSGWVKQSRAPDEQASGALLFWARSTKWPTPTGSFGSIGFVAEKEFAAENYPRALPFRVTNDLSRFTFSFVFSACRAVAWAKEDVLRLRRRSVGDGGRLTVTAARTIQTDDLLSEMSNGLLAKTSEFRHDPNFSFRPRPLEVDPLSGSPSLKLDKVNRKGL
jgi:hypothetical protein